MGPYECRFDTIGGAVDLAQDHGLDYISVLNTDVSLHLNSHRVDLQSLEVAPGGSDIASLALDGGVFAPYEVSIAAQSGAVGLLTVGSGTELGPEGSTWAVRVGSGGSGVLTVAVGGVVETQFLAVATARGVAAEDGFVEVAGGVMNAGYLHVGYDPDLGVPGGIGRIRVDQGGTLTAEEVTLAPHPGVAATLTVTGAGSQFVGAFGTPILRLGNEPTKGTSYFLSRKLSCGKDLWLPLRAMCAKK